jgi:predicted nuclease with TOPRIM domain
MKEQLQKRLQELRSEYEAGQKMLADLEAQQTNLRGTLLRISGAMQVLEEVLGEELGDAVENGDGATENRTIESVEVP